MTAFLIPECMLDLVCGVYVLLTRRGFFIFGFFYLQDVAIAYGFNSIKDKAVADNKGSKRLAGSLTLLPLNEISDLIRKEV